MQKPFVGVVEANRRPVFITARPLVVVIPGERLLKGGRVFKDKAFVADQGFADLALHAFLALGAVAFIHEDEIPPGERRWLDARALVLLLRHEAADADDFDGVRRVREIPRAAGIEQAARQARRLQLPQMLRAQVRPRRDEQDVRDGFRAVVVEELEIIQVEEQRLA